MPLNLSRKEQAQNCLLEANPRSHDFLKGLSKTSQVAGSYTRTRDVILKRQVNNTETF